MFFELFIKNKLVFNTCWEDPDIDLEFFDLNENSIVLNITSAGCNTLNYLLKEPKKIISCDVNPAQNALLELKISLIKNTDHSTFYSFFGNGYHPDNKRIYINLLRNDLTMKSRKYWDKNISYFDKAFYRKGTTGIASKLIMFLLNNNSELKSLTKDFFESRSLSSQQEIYGSIDKILWTGKLKKLLNKTSFMKMLGVPKAQLDSFARSGNATIFIRKKLRQLFLNTPVDNNYFWQLYYYGKYQKDSLPDYLKEENFEVLRRNIYKIDVRNSRIENELNDEITHINLLDHMDWHLENPERNSFLIRKILKVNIQKTIFRTASEDIDWLDNDVLQKINYLDTTGKDRVGTYGKTCVIQ